MTTKKVLPAIVTLTVAIDIPYQFTGIPEGDEGALLASTARELRAADGDWLADFLYEHEVNVVSVTKDEEGEAAA